MPKPAPQANRSDDEDLAVSNGQILFAVLSVLFLSALAVPITLFAPKDGGTVAIIMAPWWDRMAMMEQVWAAGGWVTNAMPAAIFARGDAGFIDRLDAGWGLVLDGDSVASLCGVTIVKGYD